MINIKSEREIELLKEAGRLTYLTHKEVEKQQAVRIMTGAKIPNGCDCVIRQESTDYGMETVEIYEEIKHHQNYCFEGEDIKKGSNLFYAFLVVLLRINLATTGQKRTSAPYHV